MAMTRTFFLTLSALLACGEGPADPAPDALPDACRIPVSDSRTWALRDVVVQSWETGTREPGRTVVVVDGRIAEIGVAPEIPEGAVVVEGCGRTVVPGLADMHVHLRRGDLGAYLASGVTTVRNLWGFPDLQAMMAEQADGTLLAPRIYGMSPGLDGLPEKWPFTQLVLDTTDATSVVRAQVDAGWGHLKLYQDLGSETFDAVIRAATAAGVSFGGHVPHRVGLSRALNAGYRHIEHLSGYELALNGGSARGAFGWRGIDRSGFAPLVAETVAAGTWNCPTLEIFRQIAAGDEDVAEPRRAFVRALFDAGAGLLIGTDSGIDRTQPGISLHQELAEFVRAGIPALDVLRIATLEAARYLGEEGEFGAVAVGMRGDLILVRGDPLVDLSTLARPDLVLADGRHAGGG